MSMNLAQADLKIIPKDCSESGIPKLPCDNKEANASKNSLVLAMAYVPMQQFRELYDQDYALPIGTIFKELDLPFYGIGGSLL